MGYFDKYKARMNVECPSFAEYYHDAQQAYINENFENASGNTTVTLNGVVYDVRFEKVNTYKSSTTTITDNYRKVLFKNIDTIVHIGDVFTDAEGEKWLTLDVAKTNVSSSCVVARCNAVLKFYTTGKVLVTLDAFVSENMDSVEEGKVISVINDTLVCLTPYNDISRMITENKRFIINDESWKVVGKNNAKVRKGRGLSVFTLKSDMDTRDDFTTGIAYNDGDDEVTDVYSIRIKNEYAVTLGHYTNWQIQWEVLKNGKVVNLPVAFTSSNTSAVTVNTSGLCTSKGINASSTITVRLASNQSVFTTVAITINSQIAHKYTIDIDGSDEITLGTINNYTAVVRDKGVDMSDYAVDWSIDYLGCLPGIAMLKNVTDKGVQVEVNNGNMIGKINLIAKYRTDNTVYVIKQLTISAGGYW